MKWEIAFDEEFAEWILVLKTGVRRKILATIPILGEYGPTLGRPRVDTVKGSAYPNMKELRVQHAGEPWRILFAFDPERSAVLLLGGNKARDKQWYERNIPIADARYARHLAKLKEHGDHGD
jgi:hypothetical protein